MKYIINGHEYTTFYQGLSVYCVDGVQYFTLEGASKALGMTSDELSDFNWEHRHDS